MLLVRGGSVQGLLLWLDRLCYGAYNYAYYMLGAALNTFFPLYIAALLRTYGLYIGSQTLGQALRLDLQERFALSPVSEPREIAETVAGATLAIADARSVARF